MIIVHKLGRQRHLAQSVLGTDDGMRRLIAAKHSALSCRGVFIKVAVVTTLRNTVLERDRAGKDATTALVKKMHIGAGDFSRLMATSGRRYWMTSAIIVEYDGTLIARYISIIQTN